MRPALCMITVLIAIFVSCGLAFAANPPICPYIIEWSTDIGNWARGAPWIKVHYAWNIAAAKATGAKVFYRPWDADEQYHDDGCLPSNRTGVQYADMVWAKIANLQEKPDAVGYRNEFNWDNPAASKRTCAEFVNYANRLRQLGYKGKIIFGSFGVGWVDANVWSDSDLTAAVNASDGVETHEYFDLDVNCCAPWLAFRHRDIALANNAYLRTKEWYIGEFGSDRVCGHCPSCDDYPKCRGGWRDQNKLTEEAYIRQMQVYRAGCADQVVAVFVFQIGSPGWADFEVFGTSVANWMKTTWNVTPGRVAGTVRNSSGLPLMGAIVTAEPGSYTTVSGDGGAYAIESIPPGVYSVTAKCNGYAQITQSGVVVNSGQTTTLSFVLPPLTPISSAKHAENGSYVIISGVVTGQFPVNGAQERIYLESQDRTAGIGVLTAAPVSVGDQVQCAGTLVSISGERMLNGASVVRTGTNGLLSPIGLTNRYLGGGAFGKQSAVLDTPPDTYSVGLNNVGLLVRSWGRVSHVDPGGAFFYLDDGSGIQDGSGFKGVRVDCSGLPLPDTGRYVTVTGISAVTAVNGKLVRLLRPRSEADLSYRTGTNYLLNPGFESGNLANWTVYGTVDGIQSGTWFAGISAHSGSRFIGSAADGGTKSGGVYQRIRVAAGKYQARAWSCVFHGDNPENSAVNRIGIDPSGGTNPFVDTVVWSPLDSQSQKWYCQWRELATPVVTCADGYITVFLDMKQNNPWSWHINCFDDAGLYSVLD
ncbi:MAG: carboxypeptidase regulatory-like domain-containing protein [Armatimonadota bacterium]|nr:carboxypeptidase regulatory-like domain-containing protein [Armatimonadota bacterium]